MELKETPGVVLIIGLTFLVMATMALALNSYRVSLYQTNSSSDYFVYNNSKTLSPVGQGITSDTVQVYNQSWLEFDGEDDYVTITRSNTLIGKNITISGVLNISDFTDDNYIVGYLDASGDMGGYRFYVTSTKQIFGYVANATAFKACNGGIHSIETGQYSYLTMKFTMGNNLTFYVNGTPVNSTVCELGVEGITTGNAGNMRVGAIGSNFAVGTTELNGTYYGLQIYNDSLTDAQILRLYNETIVGRNLKSPVLVLSYHQIRDDAIADTVVNTSNFASQMAYLNSSGFNTITLKDYYDYRSGLTTLPTKPVILMFDDGFANIIGQNGTDVMDNYDYVGVYGIITSKVGTGSGTTRYANWNEIISVKNLGWEIASHSNDTESFLSTALDSRLYKFSNTKTEIENNLSSTINTFVYPSNLRNATTDSECELYYNVCTGSSTSLPIYDNTNMIGNIGRIIIHGGDNLTEFKQLFKIETTKVLDLKLNEQNGTTAYDSSGNGNNGTISGATYNNDNVLLTLTKDSDYTLNSNNGTFSAPQLLYSYIAAAWNYNADSRAGSVAGAGETNIGDNTSIVGMVLTIALIGVVLVILLGSFMNFRRRV